MGTQSNSVIHHVAASAASQQRVSDERWGEVFQKTWAAAFEDRACCKLRASKSCLPSRVAFSTFIHKTLDPRFTTSRLLNIIIHTPKIRTLDNSKWLAAKVRSSPPRRRADCARESTCRTALTRCSTGKTGGKTGGKAGGDSTGKTQKSHSAKAGLQVRDTQS